MRINLICQNTPLAGGPSGRDNETTTRNHLDTESFATAYRCIDASIGAFVTRPVVAGKPPTINRPPGASETCTAREVIAGYGRCWRKAAVGKLTISAT
jgi:hypothetical protein